MYLAVLLVRTYCLNLLNVAGPPIFEAWTLIPRDAVFFWVKTNKLFFLKAGREDHHFLCMHHILLHELLKHSKAPKSRAFLATSSEQAQHETAVILWLPYTASFHCPVITYRSDFFGKFVTINPATRVLISGTKWVGPELPFGEAQSNSDPKLKIRTQVHPGW